MKKSEMIQKVDALVSKFLGFPTGLSGISRENKVQLQERIDHYEKMIEHKEAANKIIDGYSNRDWILKISMMGENAPLVDRQNRWDADWNLYMANGIWLDASEGQINSWLQNLGPRPA